MGSEWPRVPLGQVATLRSGYSFKSTDWTSQGIPVVKIANVKAGRLAMDGCSFVTPRVAASASEFELASGDILLGMTGYIGEVALVRESDLPAVLNQRVGRFTIRDRSRLNSGYLYQVLRSPIIRARLEALGYGSAQANISPSVVEGIPITLPPLSDQRRIARTLGNLDDKIELNRRMGQTLESMARDLFKSWFVDFDPVRAKSEGRDPGLPSRFAKLFPESFEDSEIGEIPTGWRIGRLAEKLAELVSGARPKGGSTSHGVPSIGAENVIGLGRYDYDAEKYVPEDFFLALERKGASIRAGDVLLYKDGAQVGRKTYFDSGFPHPRCAVNEHVFVLRMTRREEQRFLFFWLDQAWMTQEIVNLNSNSAQPGINQVGVRGLKLLIPPDDVVGAFDGEAAGLTRRLFESRKESIDLAGLREALLPVLLSEHTGVGKVQ